MASIDRATGNVKSYAALLESARTEDSKALAPRLLLVRHYLLTGNPTRALDIAMEAGTIEPKHPDVLNALGEAYSANGDKIGAAGTYAELANVIPLSPLAQYRLALAYLAKEDYRAALDPLKRALRLKADYLDAEVALALLEYRASRYDDLLRLAQDSATTSQASDRLHARGRRLDGATEVRRRETRTRRRSRGAKAMAWQ